MILNFTEMEEKHLPEFKGGVGELIAKMHSDDNGKILFGRLKPGNTIGMHSHDTSSEMIYIISGMAEYDCDGTIEKVPAGQCHYCPKGSSHCMMNNTQEDIVFFAVVPEQ